MYFEVYTVSAAVQSPKKLRRWISPPPGLLSWLQRVRLRYDTVTVRINGTAWYSTVRLRYGTAVAVQYDEARDTRHYGMARYSFSAVLVRVIVQYHTV